MLSRQPGSLDTSQWTGQHGATASCALDAWPKPCRAAAELPAPPCAVPQLQDAERRVDMLISRKKHELQEMYASFRRGEPPPAALTCRFMRECTCAAAVIVLCSDYALWLVRTTAKPPGRLFPPPLHVLRTATLLPINHCCRPPLLPQARLAVRRQPARRARSCECTFAPSTTTSRCGAIRALPGAAQHVPLAAIHLLLVLCALNAR